MNHANFIGSQIDEAILIYDIFNTFIDLNLCYCLFSYISISQNQVMAQSAIGTLGWCHKFDSGNRNIMYQMNALNLSKELNNILIINGIQCNQTQTVKYVNGKLKKENKTKKKLFNTLINHALQMGAYCFIYVNCGITVGISIIGTYFMTAKEIINYYDCVQIFYRKFYEQHPHQLLSYMEMVPEEEYIREQEFNIDDFKILMKKKNQRELKITNKENFYIKKINFETEKIENLNQITNQIEKEIQNEKNQQKEEEFRIKFNDFLQRIYSPLKSFQTKYNTQFFTKQRDDEKDFFFQNWEKKIDRNNLIKRIINDFNFLTIPTPLSNYITRSQIKIIQDLRDNQDDYEINLLIECIEKVFYNIEKDQDLECNEDLEESHQMKSNQAKNMFNRQCFHKFRQRSQSNEEIYSD